MSANSDLVTNIIKFGNQNNGRDKIFRLVQYGSKMVWWHIEQHSGPNETVEKMKKLESSLSMTRKLLRFGKSLDFMQGALKSIHLQDIVLRLTITLSKINQAFYLLFDHVVYAHNVGLISTDKKKWSQLSAKFWIVSLILNLARNLYDIVNIVNHELRIRVSQQKRSQYSNGDTYHSEKTRLPLNNTQLARKCISENMPVWLDLVKNLSDLVLPLNSLGKVNASAGTQGFLGLISSIVGVATVWNPMLKLVP